MADLRIFVIGANAAIAEGIIQRLVRNGGSSWRIQGSVNFMRKEIELELVEKYSEQEMIAVLEKRPAAKKTLVIFCNGITDNALFYELNRQKLDRIIEVNLTLPLSITNVFLRKMPLDEVRFIYLSSTRAQLGDPGITLYSATKEALKTATKVLSLEYGVTKKYFFVISLGLTEKGLIGKINHKNSTS